MEPDEPKPYRSKKKARAWRRQFKHYNEPCHLCHGPIDYEAAHTDPHSLEIDHVIPLSLGGADDGDNIKAAHQSCNRRKYNMHPDAVSHPKRGNVEPFRTTPHGYSKPATANQWLRVSGTLTDESPEQIRSLTRSYEEEHGLPISR